MRCAFLGLLLLGALPYRANGQNAGAGGLAGMTCLRVAVSIAGRAKELLDSGTVHTTVELSLRRSGISIIPADTTTLPTSTKCGEVEVNLTASEITSAGAVIARPFVVDVRVTRWATLVGESRPRRLPVWTVGALNWTRASLWEAVRSLINDCIDRLANDFLSARTKTGN